MAKALQQRRAALERPEWNSESEDEAEHIALPAMAEALAEPAAKASAALSKAKAQQPTAAPEAKATVIYLGHIPHGFYEEQMRGFFSQFGTVGRLRLVRNKKVRCPPEARARMHPTGPARRRRPPQR